jgi:hypothetical protein
MRIQALHCHRHYDCGSDDQGSCLGKIGLFAPRLPDVDIVNQKCHSYPVDKKPSEGHDWSPTLELYRSTKAKAVWLPPNR